MRKQFPFSILKIIPYKLILLTGFITLNTWTLVAQEGGKVQELIPRTLSDFKIQTLPSDTLVILAINSKSCLRSLELYSTAYKRSTQLGSIPIFLIEGIRNKERFQFLSDVLKIPAKGKDIIVNDELYNLLNPEYDHVVLVVHKNKLIRRESYFSFIERADRILHDHKNLLQPESMDSVLLDESNYTLHKNSSFEVLNDSSLFVFDKLYGNLLLYNTMNGVCKGFFELNSNQIPSLYRSYYAKHPQTIAFVLNQRDSILALREPFESFVFESYSLTSSHIYVVLNLKHPFFIYKEGSFERKNNAYAKFVLKLDFNLNLQSINPIFSKLDVSNCKDCYLDLQNHFAVQDSNCLIFRFACASFPERLPMHVKYRLNAQQNWEQDSVFPIRMPTLFTDKLYNYDFSTCYTFRWNHQFYTTFEILPYFYNLSGNEDIPIQSTQFASEDFSMRDLTTFSIGYSLMRNALWTNQANDLRMATFDRNNLITIRTFQPSLHSQNIIHTTFKRRWGPYRLNQDYLFFLEQDQNEAIYFYRYRY